ncbi:hypothetical protein BD289DRAFT_433250 [Coniella lustricola]|uniref:Uncharacterized protein n=1 Tax=Coniella lustricola TaxID=2025994 RepID=A0A2T3A8T3_9PEZI|nr:hypothetical protein BD289DRAFT_433250 [Coniella lustricola]
MLAIDFIPLLFGLAQLASAGPLTRPASVDVTLATLTAAESETTAATAFVKGATTISRPASSPPSEDKEAGIQLLEQRDDSHASPQAQQRAEFATSPASTTIAAAAAATSTTAAVAAAAEDSFNESAEEAISSSTQDASTPATTAPPTDNQEVDADLAKEGYSEVTYYSCERYATATLCGWHEPVIYVGKTGGAGRQMARGGGVAGPGLAAAGAAVCGTMLTMMLRR